MNTSCIHFAKCHAFLYYFDVPYPWDTWNDILSTAAEWSRSLWGGSATDVERTEEIEAFRSWKQKVISLKKRDRLMGIIQDEHSLTQMAGSLWSNF